MRILVVVDCYLPSPKSGAKQIHDLGVEFRRLGHEVNILAPSDAIAEPLEIAHEEGMRVVRVRTGKIKATTRILRAFHEARLSKNLWKGAGRFLRENPCDLVVFYSPTIFLAELVRELKREWGCPAYLILRDIFPQWALDMGILRPGPALSYLRRKERQQYSVADVIAPISNGDLHYFSRRFPHSHYRLEVLYIWASAEEANLPVTSYRRQLGLEDKVVFFYGGNIGVAQDMDNIVRLAANVSHDPRIHFLIVGEGTGAGQMTQSIAARDLKNIQVLPAVAQREYLAMVAEFDVGLVTLDRRLKTHNVPAKMLSYLYWGKPVLASINPGNDLFAILSECPAGLCLANGDDAELSAAALRLASDAALRDVMGKNARCLLESKFSVRAAAERILRHFPGPENAAETATAVPIAARAPAKQPCSTTY